MSRYSPTPLERRAEHMSETTLDLEKYEAATTELVDVWKANFSYQPVTTREVLYAAIEEDRHILYALRVVQPDFHTNPLPRLLDRWLREHENHLFLTSDGEPVRFMQTRDRKWCLRDSDNLLRVAGIAV